MNWKALFKSIGIVFGAISMVFGLIFMLIGLPILLGSIHPYLAIVSAWFVWGIFGSLLWPFKEDYLSIFDYIKRFVYGLLTSAGIIGSFILFLEAMINYPETTQHVIMIVLVFFFIGTIISLVKEVYNSQKKKGE